MSSPGQEPRLFKAALAGDVGTIEQLLRAGVFVNARDGVRSQLLLFCRSASKGVSLDAVSVDRRATPHYTTPRIKAVLRQSASSCALALTKSWGTRAARHPSSRPAPADKQTSHASS